MGLDAVIARSEPVYLLDDNHMFNEIILEAEKLIYGGLPYDVPLPIDERVLDHVEKRLRAFCDTPAQTSISDKGFWIEPQDPHVAAAQYLKMVAEMRTGLMEGECYFYASSA